MKVLASLLCVTTARSFLASQWAEVGVPASDQQLDITLALHQRNLDILEKKFWAVSDPKSPSYGQFMTRDEVADLTALSPASIQAVTEWLSASKVPHKLGAGRDYVEATPTVAQAEVLFNVTLRAFAHRDTGVVRLHALQSASIPQQLSESIWLVHGLQINGRIHASTPAKLPQPNQRRLLQAYVTPTDQRTWYNVSASYTGSNEKNILSFYGEGGQYYSEKDLQSFMKKYDEPYRAVAKVVGTNNPSSPGVEASGDLEYGMALAKGVKTYFWHVTGDDNTGSFLGWCTQMSGAADADFAQVTSISYAGENEDTYKADFLTAVNTCFQKVGVRGGSILFASGDDGAKGYKGSDSNWEPTWPACSPYVTAVGGTSGGKQPAGASLSGGGFSKTFPMGDYQKDAVAAYLSRSGLPAAGGWQKYKGNRAFPDVSSVCAMFDILVGGSSWPGVGTSNSAPAVSAMISLLNDIRLNQGKPVLGFLNPWLYQTAAAHPKAFYDVVDGSNGFPATPGWDAVTGLGTLNWGVLSGLV